MHSVTGENADWQKDVDDRVNYALKFAKKSGIVKTGDVIVAVTGSRRGAGSNNAVKLM